MTRAKYINNLMATYQVIHVLADKNNCRVLHLRHKRLGKDLVLHSFPTPVTTYEVLCGFRCQYLPLVYDAITLEDGQIVLEEYIQGATLADMMAGERYTYHKAKKVLTAVCNGLSLLHRHNLVHRDVKPENVMVDQHGRVVLIDFNASRQFSVDSKDTVIMGTIGYLAPEQLGLSQSSTYTDIYATGVLLNVMLTGKHPSEKLAKGRAGRIVRTCTNINPGDRFLSAEKLRKAL